MDDKIISDRTLETDRQEQEERRHAAELPPEDRDASENTGSLLSGDALSGAGDTTDTTAPTAADNAPDTGGADVGVDRDAIEWQDGEPTDEDKRKLSEEAYFPGNNALHRY